MNHHQPVSPADPNAELPSWGSDGGLDEVTARLRPYLVRRSRAILHNCHDAEDCAQDALGTVLRLWRPGRFPALPPTVQAYQMLLGRITERMAKRQRRRANLTANGVPVDQVCSTEAEPPRLLEQAEDRQRLLARLAELDHASLLLVVAQLFGCSGSEIAATMACSRNAIYLRCRRIRGGLREKTPPVWPSAGGKPEWTHPETAT